MSVNKYYIEDNRTDKEKYLTGYGFKLGSAEAEKAWQVKCVFMVRRHPNHRDIEYYRSQIDGSYGDDDILKPHMVMGDIQPYKSMIDGQIIESRSRHRAHLKQHNCLEVGNETKYLKSKPVTELPGLKEEIIRQTYARK